MHFYDLDTTFGFGQYQGQTVQQVLERDASYLNFCVQSLDHFALRRADVEGWQEQYPKLRTRLSANAWSKIDEKEAALAAYAAKAARERQYAERDDSDDDYYSRRDADRDTFDALTDGQYGDYDDFGGDMDSLHDAMGW